MPRTSAPINPRGITLKFRTADMHRSVRKFATTYKHIGPLIAKVGEGDLCRPSARNTSARSIYGLQRTQKNGGYGACAVHLDERVLHTRHYRFRLGPHLGAAACVV